MQDKFGAPIPDSQVEPLVSYLTKYYGVETNAPANAKPSGVAPNPPAPNAPSSAVGAEAIITKYGCYACHGASAKIVGPSYQEIAAKYRGDPQAAARIAEQIHKGGSGKWGSTLMPPFPAITDAETKTLTEWILSRK
jgi:cytochrome c551/c552